ncbi:MAG TPA: (2Fe-2S) ferredoxin domain-containing protein, partial [candidate division Zixibacteria bacterium]|nr:(2Fe-2S) ferredoxin domain-containing protein [candidate division Zixibacteria bacterium]
MRIENPRQLVQMQKEYLADQSKYPKKVMVCCGTGCLANGAMKIVDAFRDTLDKRKVKGFAVEALKETGCHGFCEQGPLVIIEPQGTFYTKVKAKDVEKIIDESIESDTVVDKLLYTDPVKKEKIEHYGEVEFFKHQQRLALRNLGKIAA